MCVSVCVGTALINLEHLDSLVVESNAFTDRLTNITDEALFLQQTRCKIFSNCIYYDLGQQFSL